MGNNTLRHYWSIQTYYMVVLVCSKFHQDLSSILIFHKWVRICHLEYSFSNRHCSHSFLYQSSCVHCFLFCNHRNNGCRSEHLYMEDHLLPYICLFRCQAIKGKYRLDLHCINLPMSRYIYTCTLLFLRSLNSFLLVFYKADSIYPRL